MSSPAVVRITGASGPAVVRVLPPGVGITLPQALGTTASPTFVGLTLSGRSVDSGKLAVFGAGGAIGALPLGSGLSIVGGDLTATASGSGTVTSVGLSVPTGLSVANSPVTTAGTLAITFDTGYSIPTTARQGQWDTAYSESNRWDGSNTGLNAATGRASLSLGSAAQSAATDFATAAQGAKADTAVQPAGLASALAAKVDLVGGLVPSAQLPGFVDDVLEFASVAAFPATGEAGKLYISLATNRAYRWSGSIYVEINPSPGSTDAVPEGSVNLYFTTARGETAAASWWAASAAKTKLDGISSGATANATDAQLRDRSTHSGTQAFSTITSTPTTLAGYGITNGFTVVNHGSAANTTRPSGAGAVYWIGTVEPTNALNNDLWIGGA
jgi:hypothetical protein